MTEQVHCLQCGTALQASFRRCPQCAFPAMLVAGKYRLLKELAEGGFGKVYLAEHSRLDYDKERVIKVIKQEVFAIKGMDQRFRREVQVTAALSQQNEHIVRIYDDFGEEKGLGHYFVMEFLKGQTLQDKLVPGKPLLLNVALSIFRQICKGLKGCHQQKIVHRDLKPENIFLIQRDDDPHFVKIIDFGIVRAEGGGTQLTQGAIGTPLYMSPEQCVNTEGIDGRSDQYSLALIFYQMLTGRNPYGFDSDKLDQFSPMAVISSHLSQEPISLDVWLPHLGALSPVLNRALHKKPEERFLYISDFLDAVEDAVKRMDVEDMETIVALPEAVSREFSVDNALAASNTVVSYDSLDAVSGVHERSSSIPSQKKLTLILGLFLVGLSGLLFYLFFAKGGSQPTTKVVQAKVQAKSLVRSSNVKPRRRVVAKKPKQKVLKKEEVVPVVPRKKKVEKPRKRVFRRKKSRRRIVRKKQPYRRVMRRRKPKIRSRCGVAPKGFHWYETRSSSSVRLTMKILSCSSCRIRRRGRLYCLLVKKNIRPRVRVSCGGCQTCVYRLSSKRMRFRWRLKLEDADSLDEVDHRCVVP